MKLPLAIFSFTKPTPGSTVASNRIATFLAEQLCAPLYYDATVETIEAETLIIVNGPFAFCSCLPQLAEAIMAAGNIVWVQNDYTISPPKPSSKGESPFRAAFRLREQAGLPPMDYWTTVGSMTDATENSRYVNWNSLTFTKHAPKPATRRGLFYYGAYRAGRAEAFERYLSTPSAIVSSTSAKFAEALPNAQHIGGIGGAAFYPTLQEMQWGLYIEDDKSHKHFHSPANRFYEMLGAGLPMVFQPESAAMLAEAKIDVSKFVRDTEGVEMLIADRPQVRTRWQTEQRNLWGSVDHLALLQQRVQQCATEYKRAGRRKVGLK